jgi:thioredoxin 1
MMINRTLDFVNIMDKEEFLRQLRHSNLPTVVDFWAPWCLPCRKTKPILDELGQEYSGQVDFQAINADEHPDLIRKMKILSIPTLLIVDNKKEVSRLMGAQPPDIYRSLFESLAKEGELRSIPISNRDRFLRLSIGAVLAVFAWMNALWWLLPVGLVVIFWGIHDRCPVWQTITARLKRTI